MAFCKYCGTQLEDGQVCSCPQAQGVVQAAPTPSVQEPVVNNMPLGTVQQPVPVVYVKPQSQLPVYFSKLWSTIVNLLKKPVSTGVDVVNEGDKNLAFGFMGIQSVLVGLLLLVISAFLDAGFGKVLVIFLIGTALTFGMACLYPLGIMLFSKIFKKDIAFNRMVCASGINSIFAAPFIVLGILIALITGSNDGSMYGMMMSATALISWPVIVPFAGTIIGNFVTYGIVKESEDMDKDSFPYIMFFNQIALIIILALFVRIGGNIIF